ncbi:hypothetical protein B0H67DRAFT_222959 [Lasiosphaeris hirsuta]|uniref:Secreted protein n=1 Tax=Lasiosphaeris hirsuta TaxID=260670 RepID=A0AA40AFE0_9PEZI|nr:hypothetical protein B0H67DRAFT_222959 [Lasiosphaeris hirsuta]
MKCQRCLLLCYKCLSGASVPLLLGVSCANKPTRARLYRMFVCVQVSILWRGVGRGCCPSPSFRGSIRSRCGIPVVSEILIQGEAHDREMHCIRAMQCMSCLLACDVVTWACLCYFVVA